MRTKDFILLEQAYESILKEDAQDAGEDAALRSNLKQYLSMTIDAGYMEAGRFAQDRVSDVVIDRLMEFVQDHCKKAYEKGLADGQDDGISLARSLDARGAYED